MLKANRTQSPTAGQSNRTPREVNPQAMQEQAPPQQAYQQAPPQQTYQQAPPQQTYQQAPPQQTYQQASPQETYQPPAQQQANVPANRPANNAIQEFNSGVLDNIDDLSMGGNYVTVDGSDFLYKDSNETAKEIDIIVSGGKRFYQWFDEENQTHHNSDTKLDNRYRLKFELRWFEDRDGEPVEYILTLATTSAISFINYIKDLAKQGIGVNHVVTRMTISRQTRQGTQDRYSRVEFENVGSVG